MRVFMPGPNRINFLSLFCSCVGHAVILGGIIYGLSDHRPEKPGLREVRTPLVVELLPLAPDESARRNAVESAHAMKLVPALSAGGRRPAQPELPVLSAASPSTSTGEAAVAVSSEREANRGAASPADFSDYQRRLYQAVAARSRYPAEARRLSLSGVTRLAFKVDRMGKVLDSWIQESSGSELLDDAALDTLERAQPLPPIPAGLPSRMDFVIEIDLSVQQSASWPAGQ
jgi:protein TonB